MDREDGYIIKSLFISTVAVATVVTILMITSYNSEEQTISSFMAVMIAGVLGGFVSALRRKLKYEKIDPEVARLIKEDKTLLLAISFSPPVLGLIFSAVLNLVFAAQLVTSPIFPTFGCEKDMDCATFVNFVQHWGPLDSYDYAKAIVWGFIAGFFEKFVPDLLSSITKS